MFPPLYVDKDAGPLVGDPAAGASSTPTPEVAMMSRTRTVGTDQVWLQVA